MSRVGVHVASGEANAPEREQELDEWGECAAPSQVLDLAGHVAAVHAQLNPIRSRSALLDSYRRESLTILTPSRDPLPPAVAALEIAYALRWHELEDEPALAICPVSRRTALPTEAIRTLLEIA